MKGFFVTGTDTGVGKTFVACALAGAMRGRGLTVGAFKPVETGCAEEFGELVPTDAVALKKAAACPESIDDVCAYRFADPLAPSVAARNSKEAIDFKVIRTKFRTIRDSSDAVVVEGAGGLLVPVSDDRTMAHIALLLELPLIIVAPNRLGAINHTLLTVRHAISIGLEVRAVVLNNLTDKPDLSAKTNREEIERLAGVDKVIAMEFSPEDPTAPLEALLEED